MNTLKKWQYGLAIVVAFISGSLFGLSIGDTWSAVLSGIALAGSMAWILTLDWASLRLRFNELSARMSVAGVGKAMGGSFAGMLKLMWSVPYCLVTDKECRRIGAGVIFLVGLTRIMWISSVPILYDLANTDGVTLGYFFFAGIPFMLTFMLALIVVTTMIIIILAVAYKRTQQGKEGVQEESKRSTFSDSSNRDPFGNFLFDWISQFVNSEKCTAYALIDLTVTRTMNALRMFAFSFVFAVWVTCALATKKTGLSAFCAMSLVSIQLAISHLFGGIVTANPNFWLLLVVGAGVGMWLGGKIHNGLDAKMSLWNFQKPKLTFASQE